MFGLRRNEFASDLDSDIGAVLEIDCRPTRQEQMRAECIANIERLTHERERQVEAKKHAEAQIADIDGALAAERAREAALQGPVLAVAAE